MSRRHLQKLKIFFQVGLTCFFAACSSAQKLKDYPRRSLDRPYTLLVGMSEAEVNLSLGYPKSTSVYDLSQPLPFYVSWIHALSDDFSFIWFILPLGFRYQLFKVPTHQIGIQFFTHIGDPDDPSISPYFTVTERLRMSENLDIQNDLGTQVPILFKQAIINSVFSLTSGPRWQLHDDHLAHFWVAVLREQVPGVASWSFSGGLNYNYRFNEQFNLEFRFVQKVLGQRVSSISDTLGSIGIKYIW